MTNELASYIKEPFTYNKRKQLKLMRNVQSQMIEWANNVLVNDNVVFVGVSTTGINPNFDEVVELTILSVEGTTLFNEKFRPVKAITRDASKVNGISQEELLQHRPIASYWQKIAKILSGKTAIVYNAPFVQAVLRNTAIRHHLPKYNWYQKPVWEDAMDAYTRFQFSYRSPRLSSIVSLPRQYNSADSAKAIMDAVVLLSNQKVQVDAEIITEHAPELKTIRAINKQIRQGEPVKVQYSMFNVVKKAIEKVITPIGLFGTQEGFYLVGLEQGTMKSFRLDHVSLAI